MRIALCFPFLAIVSLALAADPKPPADDDVDFLLKKATTSPATRPTSLPSGSSPFKENDTDGKRPAVVTLSDNEKIKGRLSTTLEKPIRVWDDQKKEYRDIPFQFIKTIEAKVLWEREEKEWKFRESGSDIKEYSGKTYPAREMQYTFTLTNGQTITGGVVAPVYLQTPNGDKTLVLHKRDKGEVGQTLKDLIYVKSVDFSEEGK